METKKIKNKKTKIAATLAGFVLLAVALLPYLVNLDQLRPQLEAALQSRLGREVHIGYLELSLLSGGARASSLSIADDPASSPRPFLHAKSIKVGVSLASLIFSRSLHVTSLEIQEPELVLSKSRSGKWNFSSLGASSTPDSSAADVADSEPSLSTFVLDRLKITNATLILPGASASSQSHVVKNINIDLRNASYSPVQHAGTFDRCQISVRKSSARLTGTYQVRGESLIANLRLSGSQLSVDDVASILPVLGIDLPGGSKLHGGTVDTDLTLTGPVNRLITTGTVQVANSNLLGFDLGSKLASVPLLSGMPSAQNLGIVSLNSGFRVSSQGTHISNFDSKITGIGGLTGDGDIDSTNHLKFHMKAHVASDGLVRQGMNRVGLKSVPDDIPFLVAGTTSMPIFRPDVTETAKQVLADKGKDAIEKGIKGVIGDKEKKAPTAAPETKITNPVTATVNEAPPAPAPKKHRSLNPLHWGWKNKDKDKEKHKDDGTALTAKK
jgi:hypothetical protein